MARVVLILSCASFVAATNDTTDDSSVTTETTSRPLSADDINPVATVNVGTISLDKLVCNERCTGLASFWDDVNVAWREMPEATGLDRCNAVRVWAETVRCTLDLWDEASCVKSRNEVVSLAANCSTWGVDVSEDLGPGGVHGAIQNGAYNKSSCSLCSQFYGAVPRKILQSTSKAMCQTKCDEDSSCATYDYDMTRDLCRHWASCPACARAPNNCPWNVFEKPNANHVATSVPSGGKGCGSTKTIYVDATVQEENDPTAATVDPETNSTKMASAVMVASARRSSNTGLLSTSLAAGLAGLISLLLGAAA